MSNEEVDLGLLVSIYWKTEQLDIYGDCVEAG